MELMKKRLANLLSVKSLVTLVLTQRKSRRTS